ncbi:LAFA_0G24432g1_1 [Lachancea sp. 'fantastica']|nr:LAFA_0G24432g1_1 [Lachancea sp. 'fantastica']
MCLMCSAKAVFSCLSLSLSLSLSFFSGLFLLPSRVAPSLLRFSEPPIFLPSNLERLVFPAYGQLSYFSDLCTNVGSGKFPIVAVAGTTTSSAPLRKPRALGGHIGPVYPLFLHPTKIKILISPAGPLQPNRKENDFFLHRLFRVCLPQLSLHKQRKRKDPMMEQFLQILSASGPSSTVE